MTGKPSECPTQIVSMRFDLPFVREGHVRSFRFHENTKTFMAFQTILTFIFMPFVTLCHDSIYKNLYRAPNLRSVCHLMFHRTQLSGLRFAVHILFPIPIHMRGEHSVSLHNDARHIDLE